MKLSITPAAQEILQGKSEEGDRLLLDFEDGIGPFVEGAVSCQLYPAFRLLLVPQEYSLDKLGDYNLVLETALGPIYMKESSIMLLDKEVELMVEPSYRRMQLRSNSGILVPNLRLKRVQV